jgi:hypothetical protein
VNLCEAVNFCLPDWLPHGLDCVKRYQEFNKHPVFSHDELLVTVAAHEKGPTPSRWLHPHFKEMVQRELDDREAIRAFFGEREDFREQVEPEDRESEEQYQCSTCNTFVYLSQVYVPDTSIVACPRHLDELPSTGDKILSLRFDDDELGQMLHRVKARADKGGPRTASLLGAPDTDEADQRKSGRKVRPARREQLIDADAGDCSAWRPLPCAKLWARTQSQQRIGPNGPVWPFPQGSTCRRKWPRAMRMPSETRATITTKTMARPA